MVSKQPQHSNRITYTIVFSFFHLLVIVRCNVSATIFFIFANLSESHTRSRSSPPPHNTVLAQVLPAVQTLAPTPSFMIFQASCVPTCVCRNPPPTWHVQTEKKGDAKPKECQSKVLDHLLCSRAQLVDLMWKTACGPTNKECLPMHLTNLYFIGNVLKT